VIYSDDIVLQRMSCMNCSDDQRSQQHPVRTLLPDAAAQASYQRKYRQYLDLITVLQGYHARIKEHE
ncbi:MAG TPA: hypothetical protein DEP74_12805, partial [Citrobacter freundii]|nr:hypothetical protein [Citrobacter freundii]